MLLTETSPIISREQQQVCVGPITLQRHTQLQEQPITCLHSITCRPKLRGTPKTTNFQTFGLTFSELSLKQGSIRGKKQELAR